jgi:hypothetical protein
MVFNHLCGPGSKHGVLRWLEAVSLPRNFGFADGPQQHQHLLRAMEVIDEHSDRLGTILATLRTPLIDEDLSVVSLRSLKQDAARAARHCRRRCPDHARKRAHAAASNNATGSYQ